MLNFDNKICKNTILTKYLTNLPKYIYDFGEISNMFSC
jgi:hypothetical protein